MLRFVNDLGKHNLEAMVVPHNNQWTVFYVANSYIYPDEELSISYGE